MNNETNQALGMLGAMVMPAVLISASSMLILSTSTRLARVVDRVRALGAEMEVMFRAPRDGRSTLRWEEMETQLGLQTRRGRLIQRALTSFYVALGFFVATTISIGTVSYVGLAGWLPGLLGILGTTILFYGCMLLIGETSLALRSVDLEMEFVLKLRKQYTDPQDSSGGGA
jgi:hypothetical protein